MKFWIEFLKSYPLAELRYAFETWNRNGRWFPKPKDIADHCDAYRLVHANANNPIGCHRCEWTGFYQTTKAGYTERVVAECPCRANPNLREKPPYEHYGQVYGTNDMLWLFKRMTKEIKAGRKVDSEALLAELDSKRQNGKPAWR